MSEPVIVIGGIFIAGIIIYNLWLANYQKKQLIEELEKYAQLEQLRGREYAVYQNIIAQCEQRLFQKAQRISKKWIKQWDEDVRQWEKDILEIKNIGKAVKSSIPSSRIIEPLWVQGYADTFFLYKKALKVELTAEHIERIDALMMKQFFMKIYLNAIELMKKKGVTLQKFVDPLTKKKRHKPTMLSLHWCLYVIDNMITAAYEQQLQDKASGHYKELASMEIYFKDIPQYTEYEMLKEMKPGFVSMPNRCESLCIFKRELLSLLYDISSDYKKAREAFIHYKQLLETVKKGYIAFDENCCYSEFKYPIHECKEQDKSKKEDLCIAAETPTFEEVYKLGAIEWIKAANKKCDDQLIFWCQLVGSGYLGKRLEIIFGDEKVKALEKAIEEDKKQANDEILAAIYEGKNFHYHKSRAYLVQYLM